MIATCDNPVRQRRGFTLIELMFVATIIILLATILIPFVGKAVKQSRINATKSTIVLLHQAVLMYADEFKDSAGNPVYPNSSNTTGSDPCPSPWYGSQWLVECLTGYLTNWAPGVGWSGDFINTDYLEGPGFCLSRNGTRHGPYNGAEKAPTVVFSDATNATPPVLRPMFKDAFGSPILYFRLNGGGYNIADNKRPDPDPKQQQVPDTPNNYFTNNSTSDLYGAKPGDLFRTSAYRADINMDFILTSPGPDKKWYGSGPTYPDDDITNWKLNPR